ncbi:MAG: universal stress protein [Candidatus Dormibacteria bacterium]
MFERIVAAVDADPERSERVAGTTLELARAFASRVLVVHGSRVSDVVLGGVASRILHQATCPVLLVR